MEICMLNWLTLNKLEREIYDCEGYPDIIRQYRVAYAVVYNQYQNAIQNV